MSKSGTMVLGSRLGIAVTFVLSFFFLQPLKYGYFINICAKYNLALTAENCRVPSSQGQAAHAGGRATRAQVPVPTQRLL